MELQKTPQNGEDKISYFDQHFCSNHIRMLKIFLHYVPEAHRKMLSIYIKFLELQHAMNHPFHFRQMKTCDFSSLIQELIPFCTPKERQQFQSMENMFSSFEQMKNMMEMMDMMKDMFGDEEGGFDPEMLSGMMEFMKS